MKEFQHKTEDFEEVCSNAIEENKRVAVTRKGFICENCIKENQENVKKDWNNKEGKWFIFEFYYQCHIEADYCSHCFRDFNPYS